MFFREALEQGVVEFDDLLDGFLAAARGLLLQVGRDGPFLDRVIRLLAEGQRLLLEDVDDAAEVALRADRDLDGHGVGAETVDDHRERALIAGAHAVHLVDEAHARDAVLVGLAPDSLRLRLDARDGIEDDHPAVEHAQRPLDLDGKVDVAGRIDDVDAVALPLSRGRRGGDGDTALALLLHPVHRGSALVDFADLVGPAGVVEDALGGGRFARVDVGNDADISCAFEVSVCHESCGRSLPAVMRKRLVRLRHAVGLVALSNSCSCVV